MIEILLCAFAVYGVFCAFAEIYFMLTSSSCASAVFITADDNESAVEEKICNVKELMLIGGINDGPVIIDRGASPEVLARLEKEGYLIFK